MGHRNAKAHVLPECKIPVKERSDGVFQNWVDEVVFPIFQQKESVAQALQSGQGKEIAPVVEERRDQSRRCPSHGVYQCQIAPVIVIERCRDVLPVLRVEEEGEDGVVDHRFVERGLHLAEDGVRYEEVVVVVKCVQVREKPVHQSSLVSYL